jgi:hypothetical protein
MKEHIHDKNLDELTVENSAGLLQIVAVGACAFSLDNWHSKDRMQTGAALVH